MMAATSPALTVRSRPRMISVPSSTMRACRFLISSILISSRRNGDLIHSFDQFRQRVVGHYPQVQPGHALLPHDAGIEAKHIGVEAFDGPMLAIGEFHLDAMAVPPDIGDAGFLPLRFERSVKYGRNCLATDFLVLQAMGEGLK